MIREVENLCLSLKHGDFNEKTAALKKINKPLHDLKKSTPIHIAVEYDRFDLVLVLLENGACYAAPNTQGQTPLENAATHSNIRHILLAIVVEREKCRQIGKDETKIIDWIENLWSRRTDEFCSILFAKDGMGMNLLDICLSLKNVALVKALVPVAVSKCNHRNDIELPTGTIIYKALGYLDETNKILLQTVGTNRDSPLSKPVNSMQNILKIGADFTLKFASPNIYTQVISCAIKYATSDTPTLTLDLSQPLPASPKLGKQWYSYLEEASKRKQLRQHAEVLRSLLELTVIMPIVWLGYTNHILYAMQHEDFDMLKIDFNQLAKGRVLQQLSVTALNHHRRTIFSYIAEFNSNNHNNFTKSESIDMLNDFLKTCAQSCNAAHDVEEEQLVDSTAVESSILHKAVCHGRTEELKIMLDVTRDCTVNFQNIRGETLAVKAVQAFQFKMLEFLLEKKADLSIVTNNGEAPLHVAVLINNDNALCMMLDAIEKGQVETREILLRKVLDNGCEKDGATPLHLACKLGNVSTMMKLCSVGAIFNICDLKGRKPIDYVDEDQGSNNVIRALLCNCELMFELAKKPSEHTKVVQLLKDADIETRIAMAGVKIAGVTADTKPCNIVVSMVDADDQDCAKQIQSLVIKSKKF